MTELPWGAQLRFIVVVPEFASGNDHMIARRGAFGRRGIIQRPAVVGYKRHVAFAVGQVAAAMHRKAVAEGRPLVTFPIPGKETLMRLDLYFGFRPDTDGSHRRMKLSDCDNLRKTTQDALQGVLYDNDRYVTEGFTAIGEAPPKAGGDVIWIVLSRAGYRTGGQLEAIYLAEQFATAPPWRREDRRDVVLPISSRLILPGGLPQKNH